MMIKDYQQVMDWEQHVHIKDVGQIKVQNVMGHSLRGQGCLVMSLVVLHSHPLMTDFIPKYRFHYTYQVNPFIIAHSKGLTGSGRTAIIKRVSRWVLQL